MRAGAAAARALGLAAAIGGGARRACASAAGAAPPPSSASATPSTPAARPSPLAWRLLVRFGQACITIYTITHHVGFPSLVTGPSMFPAFASSGEIVLAECLPGLPERVRKGDVVICVRPVDASEHIVKRVAAVAGEAVALHPSPRAGRGLMTGGSGGASAATGGSRTIGGGGGATGGGLLYTGGAPVVGAEGGGGGGGGAKQQQQGAPARFVVPPGHVWVQGDNLAVSRDSREYGPVPLGTVRGRVVCTVWPRPRWVNAGPALPGVAAA